MSVARREHTRKIVGIALLSAIVVILQLLGGFIRFGIFSVSLVLVPIVIGAAVYGKGAGTWLGLVFGVVVLVSGDAAAFLTINAPGTIITVLLKGALAGLAAELIYMLFRKLNKYFAVVMAAIVCPVVNTGIFLLGCRLFFFETIKEWALEGNSELTAYFIFGLGIINFIPELVLNVAMSPMIVKLVEIGTSKFKKSA